MVDSKYQPWQYAANSKRYYHNGLGKVFIEPDTVVNGSSAQGISNPDVEHTLTPLNIPPLWFYKCNQCYRMLPIDKMKLKYSALGGGGISKLFHGHSPKFTLDMLLCNRCLKDYNLWSQKHVGGYGHIERDSK